MSPTTATSSATGSRASTAPPDFSWPAPHARASREGPYRFFCCTHDLFHEPTHVHVERDTEEAKVWLDSVSLDYNNGFSRLELRRIQRITTDEPVSSEPGRMKDRFWSRGRKRARKLYVGNSSCDLIPSTKDHYASPRMLGRSIHLNLIPLFVPVAPLDSNGATGGRWSQ